MSTRHGFAFICMPKCASTSIESAIAPYCNISMSGDPRLKHINANDFRETILKFHQRKIRDRSIEVFCLFRDPVEWIFSWYRYRRRDELKREGSPNRRNYTGEISFDEYVEAFLLKTDRPPYAAIGAQSDFIKLRSGGVGVDLVFSMADLSLVSSYLSEKIGAKVEIPHENASPKVSFSLEPERESRLRERLDKELRLYQAINDSGRFSVARHGDLIAQCLS